MAFARDSGELQSLSSVDMKLIALAHTLELRAHGEANLRRRPPAPRVHSKGSVHARHASTPSSHDKRTQAMLLAQAPRGDVALNMLWPVQEAARLGRGGPRVGCP